MAFTNHETKEINCKVIYCGPQGAGKLTNLRSLLMHTSKEVRSGYFTLGEPPGLKGFAFLPLSMGHVGGYHLKLHIYTMPRSCYLSTVASTIIKGVDGLVYVFDSATEALQDNVNELHEIKYLLKQEGIVSSDIPRVVQYNKRDASTAIPVDILRRCLNPEALFDNEAVATESVGTMETLAAVTKLVLKNFHVAAK